MPATFPPGSSTRYEPSPLTTPSNPFNTLQSNDSYTPRTTFSFQTAELRGHPDDDPDELSSRSSNESSPQRTNASPHSATSPQVNGSSILSSLVGDHLAVSRANKYKFVVPTMLPPNTLKRALMSRSQGSTQEKMNDEENLIALRRQFGLARWKEYAVLRHGNSVSFQTSEHGRAMIESEAIRQNNEDMTVLKEKIVGINAKIKTLRMEVEAEKLAKKEAQLRVQQVRLCARSERRERRGTEERKDEGGARNEARKIPRRP